MQRSDQDDAAGRALDIDLTRALFPWIPGGAHIALTEIALLFETREPDPRAAHCVEWAWLKPDGHGDDIHYCEMHCVASAEWPCLYHGLLSIAPRCLTPRTSLPTRLRFARRCRDLGCMFMLYRYRVEAEGQHCFAPHGPHCECVRCRPCAPCLEPEPDRDC